MTFDWQLLFSSFLPLLTAAVLGGIVGWERESWHKPAGLRTNMMVALGAATFTQLALGLVDQGPQGADPSRIIEGVATGIGFLGAGSIIQSRGEIQGITTAAGVWLVGGVGACCGARRYEIAVTAVLLAILILRLLQKVKDSLVPEQGSTAVDDQRR